MAAPPQVAVIVPVRDEVHRLPRFLATTLLWADHVVLADQSSRDGSADLARSFPRVTIVDNPLTAYDEAGRQRILIDAARQAVPMPRVFVALDADEILSANVLTSQEWRRALGAEPGTSIRLARVELCEAPTQYFRHWWADAGVRGGFAYVDDGASYVGTLIHSDRLPEPPSPRFAVDEVVVLHYARMNRRRAASKDRWYQCFEHLNFSDKWTDVEIRRRYDWFERLAPKMPRRRCLDEWTAAYVQNGIDLTEHDGDEYFWTDWDVLRMFAQHGTDEFRFLNIWDLDWEACRVDAIVHGIDGIPLRPIVRPDGGGARSVRWFLDRSKGLRYRRYTDAAMGRALPRLEVARRG